MTECYVALTHANTFRGDDVEGYIGERYDADGEPTGYTVSRTPAVFSSRADAMRAIGKLPDAFFDRYAANIVPGSP